MATRKTAAKRSVKRAVKQTTPAEELAQNGVEPIKVTQEHAAFELLQRALEDQFKDQNVLLQFKGWPVLQFSLEGKGWQSTITADVAEAIANTQKAVNRAYAAAVKQQASAIHLTDSEKNSVRFKAKVSKGSSLVTIDLSSAAQAIATNLVGKMTGPEIVITVLGLGAIWATSVAAKQFIRSRAENKNVSTQTQHALAMSKEETARLEIVTKAMAHSRPVAHAKEDFDVVQTELLQSVGDADSIALNGVKVDKTSAYELTRGTRDKAREVQLNGSYVVSEASFKGQDSTKISVRRLQDGREFTAIFQDDSLDRKQFELLREMSFAKKPVFLSINGTELRGQVTKATITEVQELKDDKKQ